MAHQDLEDKADAAAKRSPDRFLIVDDHPLFVSAFEALLRSIVPTASITASPTAREMRNQLQSPKTFDYIFLDLSLPDAVGIQSLVECRRTAPLVPVVVISGTTSTTDKRMCLEAGALGVLSKTDPHNSLYQSIDSLVHNGNLKQPLNNSHNQEGDGDLLLGSPLSGRLKEVADFIAEGASNKVISVKMGISEGTVKAHVSRLLKTLNVRNRAEAAVVLRRKR